MVNSRSALVQGRRMAAVLSGSWRPIPPEVDFEPAGWDGTATRLLETGAGGLGWWRVRGSALRKRSASQKLHEAFRLHAIEACVREHRLALILERCRAAGAEPLVAKGWAVARLYPEVGLRPYGDVDLFVRPEQHAVAATALAGFRPRELTVDLHKGCPDLADHPVSEVWARSELCTCGVSRVRTAGREDSLRHLCVHLLRHGAWHPLWLVDVAAAVESADATFDWEYCLAGTRQRTHAVVCAVGLAHQLLGARVDHTPLADRARCLPRWLAPSVLRQWALRCERLTDLPTVDALHQPLTILPALRRRWPNPIESTMSVGGPFNNVPRLPFQLADCLVRTGGFLFRLPNAWLS
jgi:hypothetical protein